MGPIDEDRFVGRDEDLVRTKIRVHEGVAARGLRPLVFELDEFFEPLRRPVITEILDRARAGKTDPALELFLLIVFKPLEDLGPRTRRERLAQ